MSTTSDDQTQVLTPPPGRPRKKWYQRWSVRILLGLAALGIIGGVAGGGSSHTTAAPAPSTSAPSAPEGYYSAKQGCQDLLAWENHPSDGDDQASKSPVVKRIATRAAGTEFGSDLAIWLGDIRAGLGGSETTALDAGKIHTDCLAQGVDVLGTSADEPSASPESQAPETPASAPAFHQQTLFSRSGSGSEDTAPFTIPDGSVNWKIIWTYNEGGFGQSVNFQIWSEDFQANVNKLGTGGSGTEYVYGDPGTHHLTVNSEGAWTIKVVTAP